VTDPATLLEALRSVPGVASADLEPDDRPEGAGTLRLQLSPGADEVQVATSVNRVLREQFGLAVDANRVQVVEEAEPLRRTEEPVAPLPRSVDDVSQTGPAAPPTADEAEPPLIPPTPIRKGLVAVPEPPVAPVVEPASAWEQVRASLDEAVTEADAHAVAPPAAPPAPPSTRVPTSGPVLVPPSVTGSSTTAVETSVGTFGQEEADEDADFAARPPRVLIQRMQLVSAGLGVTTEVTLSWQGLPFSGAADAAATPTSVHRSVAMATLRAVEAVVSGRARFELEQLEVNQLGPDRAVVVVVSMLTKAGSERLTGVSVVREDVRQAVIRATLDALNRRLESILFS
jgi:hypothetical protein